jgi:CRISPR-associated endonuclease/helicase Cas3
MQILVIDESEKKAWRRSRRILAAHLYRRGSRTFSGRLSAQGVRELVIALKSVASKNSKIAVFQLTAHAEFELVARVGNTSEWGDEGWFAHRTKTYKEAPADAKPFAAMLKLVRLLVRLAALFHDLGKANEQFQQKLRSTLPTGERVRHELLSYLMVKHWADEQARNGENWLEALVSRPSALRAMCSQGTIAISEELRVWALQPGQGQAPLIAGATEMLAEVTAGTDVLLSSMLWLILTHHRQIGAFQNDPLAYGADKYSPSLHSFANPKVSPNELNLQVQRKGAPWDDGQWLASVQANASSLLKLLADNPDLLHTVQSNPTAWEHNLALVARPSLIFSDYIASSLKAANPAKEPDVLYANTLQNKASHYELADTLPLHLLKARKAVDPVFSLTQSRAPSLPSLPLGQMPMLLSTAPTPAQFDWQREAALGIAAVPGIQDRPFFGMIISGTGAGKTVGGPKVLGAAGGNDLRYTCALGLRSLTLQTGEAYRSLLGMPENGMLTVVGDALYAKLSKNDAGASEQERSGSESLAIDGELVFDRQGVTGAKVAEALRLNKTTAQSVMQGSKVLAMTEVPVLVCTVDHLMRASVLDRGSDVLMALRLATADLILDEIDNYGLEDLQALGRLVHAAGCHGRRVILMSATVSETVLTTLHAAWLSGIRAFQFRTGRQEEPVLALVSNYLPSVIHQGASPEAAEDVTKGYVAQVCEHLAKASPKNRVTTLRVKASKSLDDAFDAIFDQALSLAREHFTVDANTGKRISCGFVRFNLVRHARQFARRMHDAYAAPQGVSLRTQCYHRRMPMMHLSTVEKTLNRILSRKDEQAIFSQPEIQAWMQVEPNADEYVLIVATTSIQETGRDHDYDWAVAEPWSTRSLTQLAGRVLRHRSKQPIQPNVALLTKELKALEKSGKNPLELAFEPLRFDKSLGEVATFDRLVAPANKYFASEWSSFLKAGLPLFKTFPSPAVEDRSLWFPASLFSTGVHAGPCLSAAYAQRAILTELEHFAQAKRMGSAKPAKCRLTVRDIVGTASADKGRLPAGELLWRRHAEEVQFRRSTAEMAQMTLDPRYGYERMTVITRTPEGRVEMKPRVSATDWKGGTALQNPQRSLVRLDLLTDADISAELAKAGASDTISKVLSHSFEIYLSADHQLTGFVDFDPLLGADTSLSMP